MRDLAQLSLAARAWTYRCEGIKGGGLRIDERRRGLLQAIADPDMLILVGRRRGWFDNAFCLHVWAAHAHLE